jgi:hypothetical protein
MREILSEKEKKKRGVQQHFGEFELRSLAQRTVENFFILQMGQSYSC